MKRLLTSICIMSVLLIPYSSINDVFAHDTIEEKKSDEEVSNVLNADVISNATDNDESKSKRDVKFEVVYELDEDDSSNQQVLSPAEPKDEMIEEITNKDNIIEELEEPELPNERPEDEEELEHSDVESLENTEETSKEAREEPLEQPVFDKRGKITEDGLIYLDDTVNRVMSEKIVKSPSNKQPGNKLMLQKEKNEAFIRDRMINFLAFQSINDRQEKTFVRNIVVESIVVKHTTAKKISL